MFDFLMFLQGLGAHTVSPLLCQLLSQSPKSIITGFPQDRSILRAGKCPSSVNLHTLFGKLAQSSIMAFRVTKFYLITTIFYFLRLLHLQDPEKCFGFFFFPPVSHGLFCGSFHMYSVLPLNTFLISRKMVCSFLFS